MKPKFVNSVKRIENLEVARYLVEPLHHEQVAIFLRQAVSVGQASQLLGLAFHKTYTLIKRLEQMGIIHVVEKQKRNGKAVLFYAAVAEKFFIANTLLPLQETLSKVNSAFETMLVKNLVHASWGDLSETCGIQIWCESTGAVRCVQVQDVDTYLEPQSLAMAATYGMWHTFQFDFEDAKELQRELFALSAKYAAKAGSQKYLVHLAMTPVILE